MPNRAAISVAGSDMSVGELVDVLWGELEWSSPTDEMSCRKSPDLRG
ncbi:hypothetical protein ACQ7CS_25040 [Escherichia coli]